MPGADTAPQGTWPGRYKPSAYPRLATYSMGKKSALSHVASVAALGAAFSHVYSRASSKSRHSSGIDNETLVDFHAKKEVLIKQLSFDLLGKKFKFSKLSAHFIKKLDGKSRVICIPTVRDRVVQRALLDYLSDRYKLQINNPISYGFLRGKGVQEAAQQACQIRKTNPWVFKTDITSFFDRVSRDKLKAKLKKIVREPSLIPLLESAIDCEILVDSNATKNRLEELEIEFGMGIRQGMPISPFLSNVMLNQFDNAVIAKGYSAVRYADDLIFFGHSEHECREIYEFCKTNLLNEGLTIPSIGEKSKSQIYSPDKAAEFLGLGLVRYHDLSYRLEVTKDQAVHIRTELFRLTDLEHLNKHNIDFFKFGQSLNSRIGGYVNAYLMCSNLKEFENKLEAIRLTIYSTVLSNLGIKPSTLSPSAKKFFRLQH